MQIEFHPLAELFPLMDGAEFDALVADISEHGLREPIILHEDKILDGRNRYRACEAAEIEPIYQDWLPEGTAHAFVVSKNLRRRHLSESQRAMIAAKLANLKRGDVTTQGERDTRISIPQAAELLNVSKATVAEARTVLAAGTPDEISAVEKGESAVSTIGRQIRANVPPSKRAKKRAEPASQVGKNPERIQKQQLNAEVWGRLRDVLANLTSLPLPTDVVAIARGNNHAAAFVDARIEKSTQWLKEFSNAWLDRE
jgi:ParB-like chromosome segregation protein Spo0J